MTTAKRTASRVQEYTVSADAIISAMTQSHEATNRIMAVQFQAVRDNFDAIHKAMADVKTDLGQDTNDARRLIDLNRIDIAQNRIVGDERYIGLVKKIWMGVGVLVTVEVLLKLFQNGQLAL